MSAKPQQEALDFGRLYRVADASRAVYRNLNDAVDQIGILQAAGACGIDRGDLRRALDRDGGRRVGIEHVQAIGALCGPDMRKTLATAVVAPWDFSIADSLPPMTDSEARARLEAALNALGPIGQAARVAALGGKP